MSKCLTMALQVPLFTKAPGSRPQVTGISDLPALMLRAHGELLDMRPEGARDDGEFGLVKAQIEGDKINLVFMLELPE